MKNIIPSVVKIIHRESKRGEFFTVFWSDNSTTTVKRADGENSDENLAFMYALAKKIFGSKSALKKLVKEKKEVFEKELEFKSSQKKLHKHDVTKSYAPFGIDDFIALLSESPVNLSPTPEIVMLKEPIFIKNGRIKRGR